MKNPASQIAKNPASQKAEKSFWSNSQNIYIILAPIGFDQEVEAEAVMDTRQLWILEAVSPKSSVKCQNL